MDALRKVRQTLLDGPERLDGFDEELFEQSRGEDHRGVSNTVSASGSTAGLELTERWEVAAR